MQSSKSISQLYKIAGDLLITGIKGLQHFSPNITFPKQNLNTNSIIFHPLKIIARCTHPQKFTQIIYSTCFEILFNAHSH